MSVTSSGPGGTLSGTSRGLGSVFSSAAVRALASVLVGIVVAWILRQPLAALLLGGKQFAGRSLVGQAGILVVGGIAFSLLTAAVLALYVSPSERAHRWLVFLAPLLFGAGIVWLCESNLALLQTVSLEDGPLEWQQFFFDAFCTILMLLAAVRVARQPGYGKWAFLAAAVMFFFISGEEISWAQRVFDFGTPADLAKINMQDEVNIHNIVAINNEQAQIYTVLGLAGGLAWLMFTRMGRAFIAAVSGIGGAWLLWDVVLPRAFSRPALSGQGLSVQVGITVVGGLAAAVIASVLLRRLEATQRERLRRWWIPPWYVCSYFLMLAILDILWWARLEPGFLWGVFGPWLGFLKQHALWDYEAAIETISASGWFLVVLRVWQEVAKRTGTDRGTASLPART